MLAEGDPVPRYRMLETARVYALERLADAGEMEATLRRHAHAVLALLEPFEQYEWRWPASAGVVPAAKVELDNLRAALEWSDSAADGPLAVALAAVSYSVWWSSSLLAEGLARCLDLRRHIDAGVSAAAAARFWLATAKLGIYSIRRESYDAALRAAALYGELDDDQRWFEALTLAAVQGTRFATVAEMETQIRARGSSGEWPARQRAKLQFARYFWFARQGWFDEALECAKRQVAICRDDGVEVASLFAMSNVTFIEALLGRPQEAIEHARTAIGRLHELDADLGAGHLYFSEIVAQLTLNRPEEALAAVRNAYPRLAREGDHYRLLLPLALISALRGELGAAARIAGFDNAVQVRSGENVSIVAPLLHERLDPLLSTRFSVDERAQLAAEGAALREEDAFKLGFDAAP